MAVKLIPVVYRRKRTEENAKLNFHTYACHGGVLNPNAVHGRGHYIRVIKGNNVNAVMSQLQDIAKGQMEAVNV